MAELFRMPAVLPLAITTQEDAVRSIRPAPAADRARRAAVRLRSRDPDLREVVTALIDAVSSLEVEVRVLQQQLHLIEAGVALEPHLVTLGGDGLSLQTRPAWPDSAEVCVVVSLQVRDAVHLLCLDATVHHTDQGAATELTFTSIPEDQRDLIVAWVFQQQARERRRDRDVDSR